MSTERLLLFDGRVEVTFWGKEYGNFSLKDSEFNRHSAVRHRLDLNRIFLPSVNFTNRVVHMDDKDTYEVKPGMWRTRSKADGGIVFYDLAGISICNADCPIGVLYDSTTHFLCMVHLGLKCFYRPDGSDSILKQALRAMKVSGEQVKDILFWFGAGVGPCCYGLDLDHEIPKWREHNRRQAQELKDLFGEEAVGGTVKSGPRAGQTAHDLYEMIWNHADALGIEMIEHLMTCTCCDLGMDGENKYWSNVRDAEKVGYRNMIVGRLVT